MKRLVLSRVLMLVAAFVLAACCLVGCTKSSPLYPINDSTDVNCFFTLGREMLEGRVPYRDLYEQKGPLLYAVFALSSLVSRVNYMGVFVLELLCFALFLYWSGQTALLYVRRSWAGYAVMAVLAALIPSSVAFENGAGVEELLLPLLAWPLYTMLGVAREKRAVSPFQAALVGVCAAVGFWCKYTCAGFFAGLALAVAVVHLVQRHTLRRLLAMVGGFLGGFALVSAGVLGYFAFHHALPDLFEQYFYNNITLYGIAEDPLPIRVWTLLTGSIHENAHTYGYLLTLGLCGLPFLAIKKWPEALTILATFAGLAVTTYVGGRDYPYYGLILAGFTVFGAIWPLWAVERVLRHLPRAATIAGTALLCLLCAASPVFAYVTTSNAEIRGLARDDMPQYQFAHIIRQVDNPTILNYGFLDAGFYLAAECSPTCRAFCLLNVPLPAIAQAQDACVVNADVDFIITRWCPLEEYGFTDSAYELITDAYQDGEVPMTFFLYARKSLDIAPATSAPDALPDDDWDEDDWDF